ncbi:MAG: hypothetical protein QHC89_25780 [Bosea sp. (in: a-proteobacteria)]|nr:hypothetical protein [Bosea sp. (in: a-proteobacteria)]
MTSTFNGLIKSILRPIALPVWRRIWARLETRIAPIESRLVELESRHAPIESRLAELESRHTALDQAWNAHLPAFLNAVSTVGAFGHRLSAQARELDQLSTRAQQLEVDGGQVARLWDRIEFVRREMMFELAHGGNSDTMRSPSRGERQPQIVARDKVEIAVTTGNVRLNLGCGHISLPNYINVDMRELPGVDIVAGVDRLPFEAGTVSEIFSAHLVEHFPQEALRRRLLPYWVSLLKPGGILQAITPDAAAMLKNAAAGDYPFEDFREVLFGAQDYEGDYHYNLLTPDSMTTLLKEAGLIEVVVPVASRRNGKCYEFEIVGRRP